jgi:hypothetical protein
VLLGAAVAAGPLVWVASDLAVTGDPLFSFLTTRRGTRALERETGLALVPVRGFWGLHDLLGLAVLLGGLVGVLLSGLRHTRARLTVLAVAVLGGMTFVVLGAGGLPLNSRYMILPGGILAMLFGYCLTGWTREGRGLLRSAWTIAAALVTAGLVLGVPGRVAELKELRRDTEASARIVRSLDALAAAPQAVRRLRACGTLYVRDGRPRPLVAYALEREPRQVVSALQERPRRDGAFLTVTARALASAHLDLFPPVAERPPAPRPRDYRVVYQSSDWELSAGPGCDG